MQGYFNYEIFGTKEEIKKIAEKMNELAKTNKDIAYLNECFYSDEYYEDEGRAEECSIAYGMGDWGSGNINDVPFMFEDMMDFLSEEFKDYKIEGEGWLLDFPPYEKWHKEKGTTGYESELEVIVSYAEVNAEDVLDEKGKFVATTVPLYCECCHDETELKIKKKSLKKGHSTKDYIIYTCKGTCSECDSDHETEITVSI